MKNTLFIFFFLSCLVAQGQIIDNSDFQFLTDEPFFNAEYLKAQGIKKITGRYSFKADLDRIRKSDRVYEYIFNTQGQLTSKWTTYFYDNKVNDTTVAFYQYDEEGRVTSIRKADPFGYYSYHYTYNDSGDVVFEEFRQDLKNNYKKSDFHINENYRVYAEKSTYQYFEGQKKRTYYNDEGRPYQYTITYYDEKGRVQEEYTQLLINTGNKTVKYEYSEDGIPSKKTLFSNLMQPVKKSYTFNYDEKGNLLEHRYFKNGEEMEEVQVVYSWKTAELKAFLSKKANTNYITILEFDFEYYK